MTLKGAVRILNKLLGKHRPETFSSSWIFRYSQPVYNFVRLNFRTELGTVDWDALTPLLKRKYQKRWKRYRVKSLAPYENQEELDKVLNKYRDKLYTIIYPLNADDERISDVVITGESLYSFKGSYRFAQDFKEGVDKYDPNLGLVYADDDPEQTGHHLDQELLICDFDKKGVLQIFSRYGMSTSLLSKAFDSKVYFKEVKEDSKTYLEFKNPIYEAAFRARRLDVMHGYAQLLAYEEVFKKLDVIYEADLSHHVLGRVKDTKEFIEYINQAVQIATNTQEDELKDKGKGPFRRKDQLYLREELLIDLDSIKPDTSLTEKHVEKLKKIFRGF